jgi:hypothetical protein
VSDAGEDDGIPNLSRPVCLDLVSSSGSGGCAVRTRHPYGVEAGTISRMGGDGLRGALLGVDDLHLSERCWQEPEQLRRANLVHQPSNWLCRAAAGRHRSSAVAQHLFRRPHCFTLCDCILRLLVYARLAGVTDPGRLSSSKAFRETDGLAP